MERILRLLAGNTSENQTLFGWLEILVGMMRNSKVDFVNRRSSLFWNKRHDESALWLEVLA